MLILTIANICFSTIGGYCVGKYLGRYVGDKIASYLAERRLKKV